MNPKLIINANTKPSPQELHERKLNELADEILQDIESLKKKVEHLKASINM